MNLTEATPEYDATPAEWHTAIANALIRERTSYVNSHVNDRHLCAGWGADYWDDIKDGAEELADALRLLPCPESSEDAQTYTLRLQGILDEKHLRTASSVVRELVEYARIRFRYRAIDECEARRIALSSTSPVECRIALDHITAGSLLVEIATKSVNSMTRNLALKKLPEADLHDLAASDRVAYVRSEAVAWMKAEEPLRKIAMTDADAEVRCAAVSRVRHQDTLRSIARQDTDRKVRLTAAGRVSDLAHLVELAITADFYVIECILDKLQNSSVHCFQIAVLTDDKYVRRAASRRVNLYWKFRIAIARLRRQNGPAPACKSSA